MSAWEALGAGSPRAECPGRRPTLLAVTDYADPDLETVAPLPPLPPPEAEDAPATSRGRSPSSAVAVGAALVVVSLVVSFGLATIVLNARDTAPKSLATAPAPTIPLIPANPGTGSTTPATTAPSQVPIDPQASVLGGLILRQSDVTAGNTVQLLDRGADLTVATLDLCNGTFPSEALRTARRQVALTDAQPALRMSIEAVLYGRPAGGDQAFSELKSVAAKCPSSPVKSPVGEDTAITTFRAAPDRAWASTPTVDRLAYDFVSVSAATGASSHSIAVYLRRGRVLMGVYFAQPDGAQIAVAGRKTIAGIVAVFEARMAKVPARIAGG
jgi:hypothetical protein